MIFGEVKSPGCEDCVVEGGRSYCTMNCSPRESVVRKAGRGELSLGFDTDMPLPDEVKNMIDDIAADEPMETPFGRCRFRDVGFRRSKGGEFFFYFKYEVIT